LPKANNWRSEDILATRNKLVDYKNRQQRTKNQWASRTDVERKNVCNKISISRKKSYIENGITQAQQTQLKNARENIDQDKRKYNQKLAIQKFWEDLRADPKRYQEHINKRKNTLSKTLETKKNEGKNI